MKKTILMFITFLLFSSLPAQAAVKKENRLWQDESFYSIMVDRFNNGDITNDVDVNAKDPLAYHGGDFQGIIDRLDYIHDMGFTAIRLTPIFDNTKNGYHGYSVTDYYKTDEHFGTIKKFQELVKEAHKRKMKVVIDFVTTNEATNHSVDKAYLIDAAKWWIKKTDIDGFSLPEVNQTKLSFWKDFSKQIKDTNKNFFLLGVLSKDTTADPKEYEQAGIDSLLDYSHLENIRKSFATTDESISQFNADTDKGQPSFLRASFMDNEYTTRFTTDIVEKRQFPGSRWKTALTYLYTTPGIPIIYYGTEIALIGGEIPDNRRQMNFRADKDLIDYITKIGELRNQLPSLTRGSMDMLYEKKGMIVYKRTYKGETSVVAINNTRKSQKVILSKDQLESGKELRGLLGGDIVRSRDNQYILILDRDNSEVYVLTEKSGANIPLIVSMIIVYILVFIFLFFIIKRRKTKKVE
ncbi:alpha-amylase family glycosyl hydrolase [Neobacillus sp. PS2-9]|uniref:alpha-amylase family glycosyl hydrolase n=1 Tax=Neobacillus sp. PS2-9 TaxID=3070676 RepID=UPI0027E0FA80|nr:alpha-amylase family glycosyl hydrolase [Neobacillus sp. PS2-9]WML57182.1 alpha-amylase family glycosyl hydrolase [Neobacillus sp. PS2-9]